ncbi:winged helix-turn-helix domain-containing protein [Virgisporangium aliadipatigenens]|nr:winged helix-turn-helix domain-containing protein [Virgisporangium aliadipatigenens]
MAVDWRSGAPGYRQVIDDIVDQIKAGKLRPGDKLPSTRELTAHYGVSETVIRMAMVELKARQFLIGQKGKGVYVATLD